MFDKNFYPTPKAVISKMIEGINLSDQLILEPSAGKGDILDFILDRLLEKCPSYLNKDNIKPDLLDNFYCIEKNPDLQNVLKGKGYNVIDSDFLSHISERTYDLIILNPPYDNAVKHFLKAFEISNGAEIVCLFNSQTIDNPFTKDRELLLEIMRQHNVKPENLGKCFSNSEHKTYVDVTLVRIPKREREVKFNFTGNSFGEKLYTVGDIQNNQLEHTDVFESLVHRYTKVKETASKILTLNKELEFYSRGLIYSDSSIVSTLFSCIEKSNNYEKAYERFIRSVRNFAWNNILNQTKVSNYVTSSVRQDIEKAKGKQASISFTVENIENLLESLLLSLKSIKQNCIIEAFDILTKYHKDNRVHTEGWCTNDMWKVNKKCILPYACENWLGKPSIHYSTREKLLDIEKALCFVSGKKFTDIKSNSIESVVSRIRNSDLAFGNWYDSEFFKFKIFKKGTLHLEFKDKFLYEQFNIIACKGKNWLPDTYGHSTTQGKSQAHPKAKAYSFSENNNKSTSGESCNSLIKASVFQLSIIDSQI